MRAALLPRTKLHGRAGGTKHVAKRQLKVVVCDVAIVIDVINVKLPRLLPEQQRLQGPSWGSIAAVALTTGSRTRAPTTDCTERGGCTAA